MAAAPLSAAFAGAEELLLASSGHATLAVVTRTPTPCSVPHHQDQCESVLDLVEEASNCEVPSWLATGAFRNCNDDAFNTAAESYQGMRCQPLSSTGCMRPQQEPSSPPFSSGSMANISCVATHVRRHERRQDPRTPFVQHHVDLAV